ncbi:hypothetical protein JIQ42_07037 [Leishmania sp. Namibia]|uniref:hypothetical protein n=1 Tax=Leishmania sp. Namibia TaxID=2802991 RepID=UPI001B41CDB1|nr:hypothetical protein JIQ42_07037 [Leishmania sp. Namibia]
MLPFTVPKCPAASVAVCAVHVRHKCGKSPVDTSAPTLGLSCPECVRETPKCLRFCKRAVSASLSVAGVPVVPLRRRAGRRQLL